MQGFGSPGLSSSWQSTNILLTRYKVGSISSCQSRSSLHWENIARVRNCPDTTISNSVFTVSRQVTPWQVPARQVPGGQVPGGQAPGRTSYPRTSAMEDKFPKLSDSIKKGLALVPLVLVLLILQLSLLLYMTQPCARRAHRHPKLGYILPTIVECCSVGGVYVPFGHRVGSCTFL